MRYSVLYKASVSLTADFRSSPLLLFSSKRSKTLFAVSMTGTFFSLVYTPIPRFGKSVFQDISLKAKIREQFTTWCFRPFNVFLFFAEKLVCQLLLLSLRFQSLNWRASLLPVRKSTFSVTLRHNKVYFQRGHRISVQPRESPQFR